jgi:hypothetical protein
MLVLLHIIFFLSLYRTFFAFSHLLLTAAPCYFPVNPAPIFHFSVSLLLRLFFRLFVVFLLICPVLSAFSHLLTPRLRYQLLFRSHNLATNLCFTTKSLASGYTSNGNAKCRLGSRSDMRLFPPLTPLVSPLSTRPYLERHLA